MKNNLWLIITREGKEPVIINVKSIKDAKNILETFAINKNGNIKKEFLGTGLNGIFFCHSDINNPSFKVKATFSSSVITELDPLMMEQHIRTLESIDDKAKIKFHKNIIEVGYNFSFSNELHYSRFMEAENGARLMIKNMRKTATDKGLALGYYELDNSEFNMEYDITFLAKIKRIKHIEDLSNLIITPDEKFEKETENYKERMHKNISQWYNNGGYNE